MSAVSVRRSSKKPVSQARLRFAEEVLERAGVVDEIMHRNLVQAFATVPREMFVDNALAVRAMDDDALPIGFGQTISRPSTVARMLGLVGIERGMRVLEIGCGSGYCSAIMSALGAQVFAIEYIGPLAQQTRKRLDALGYYNILIHRGDGQKGWLEHAPYDAIVISAAFGQISDDLLVQIKTPGGKLIAPLGDAKSQTMYLWEAQPSMQHTAAQRSGMHRSGAQNFHALGNNGQASNTNGSNTKGTADRFSIVRLESCNFVEGQGQ
jgi:protein-L-isoaspartate(D-aspartate) O-methyltransferase